MKTEVAYMLAIAVSYILGSIPFGYLLGKSKGIDIRKVGSGNIGATNVWRELGKKYGITTFALDVCKGVAACFVPKLVWSITGLEPCLIFAALSCGIAAIVGHSFPIFLGFKGGKGVATGLGIACSLIPHSALMGVFVWIVLFLISRYVSFASIFAAVAVGVSVWFVSPSACFAQPEGGSGAVLPAIVSVLCLVVVLKHRSNIARLLRGTENRFCFTKKQLEKRERNAKK